MPRIWTGIIYRIENQCGRYRGNQGWNKHAQAAAARVKGSCVPGWAEVLGTRRAGSRQEEGPELQNHPDLTQNGAQIPTWPLANSGSWERCSILPHPPPRHMLLIKNLSEKGCG